VTLGAYLLYNWSVTQVKVTLAAAYVNLIPVFTLLCINFVCHLTLSTIIFKSLLKQKRLHLRNIS
jgi:drug/metabolite transporter (DMT)-like permease